MNIGLCGYGVIGSGLFNLLKNNNDFKVLKVLDLPTKKDVLKDLYVDDYKKIVNDNNIDIVVEAMGGEKLPYIIIKEALTNKKHVVTSNKEVVSMHLKEFLELAKANDVKFLFEASVGGGIPIICNLIHNIKSNKVNHIYGILNGTTNFILTKMNEGLQFEEALKKAQELGFAEADPTADLLGLDMVRKIAILSDLAYDTFIDISNIPHFGIENVNKELIDKLNIKGYNLKFVCESIRNNDEISLIVSPVAVKKDSIISSISYENNIVVFESDTNKELSFIGKGAGANPTASAMISDLYYIIKDELKIDLKLDKNYKIVNKEYKEYVEGVRVF